MLAVVLFAALAACSSPPPPAPIPAPDKPRSEAPTPTRLAATPGPTLAGTCDASAGVWRGDVLWVADDEHNRLHRFDPQGTPLGALPLGDAFAAMRGDEADLEGVARIGDVVWWIGSHDRGKGTTPRPARQRLAPVRLGDETITAAGSLRTDLLSRLAAHEALAPVLAATEGHTSKHPDGLSIEGLAASDDGLWIGFRAPLRHGHALVVPVRDPAGAAEVGPPVWLDLSGRGVRAMERVGDALYLVAGPVDGGGPFALYRWSPGSEPEPIDLSLGALRPEGLAWHEATGRLWLLSDDGGLPMGDDDCKDLPRAKRQARTAWWSPTTP